MVEHSSQVPTRQLDGGAPASHPAIALEYARFRVRVGLASAAEQPLIDERYRIERTLGRGAMGVVYLVWDERLRRPVALKLVQPQAGLDADELHARLEREAQALAKVDHPNVVHIHDVGSHCGATYFTMQYVPGTTLRRWQQGRRRDELLDAYSQAARGLAAAHAGGVVHRDFKPDNVLVGDDGIVRVVDFGIAGALELDELTDTHESIVEVRRATHDEPSRPDLRIESPTLERLTRTGMLLGTPPYMAPELLEGASASERSDQFGFCVALWEALVGERPFAGRTAGELREAFERRPQAGELPSRLRAILLRGLERASERRFADMNELVAALERARARPRRVVISGGLVLGLLAAAALGWGLAPDEQRATSRSCEALVEQVDRVWTPARRDELAALARFDPQASAYAITTIDAQVQRWRESASSLCRGQDAPASDSRVRGCHEAWLLALERSIELLRTRASERTMTNAAGLLARLVPPRGNYCALEPDPALDREIARMAAGAREAAEFGDIERAEELAEAALARTDTLARPSVDHAEALVALAEVRQLAGRDDLARTSFAEAQAEALASGHRGALLSTALWRAKLAVAPGRPPQVELATSYLELAAPIADALRLDPIDPRRGDIEVARGLVAQARGDLRAALDHYEAARAIYAAAERPPLVARALIDIGTIDIQLGRLDAAKLAYERALVLLDQNGMHRHHLGLRAAYHLGLLATQTGDLAGLAWLDEVVSFDPDPTTRLRAAGYGLVLAYEAAPLALARDWAARARAALHRHPAPPADLAVEIELSAAIVDASAGDPSGEARIDAAIAQAASVDRETEVNAMCSRVDWLETQARCAEAARRLAELDRLVASESEDFRALVYADWRTDHPSSECSDKQSAEQ